MEVIFYDATGNNFNIKLGRAANNNAQHRAPYSAHTHTT